MAPGFVLTGAPLTRDGSPRIRVTGLAYPVASVNGLFFTQDRMAVTQGRLASPQRADEIVMAPVVAKLLGFHVGQVIPFGFYSDAQQSLPGFGTKAVATGAARQYEDRRPRVVELRDRRGRRRHPSRRSSR